MLFLYIITDNKIPVSSIDIALLIYYRCGLVALSMASQNLSDFPVTTDYLYKEAQSQEFTIQGEMFSGKYYYSIFGT